MLFFVIRLIRHICSSHWGHVPDLVTLLCLHWRFFVIRLGRMLTTPTVLWWRRFVSDSELAFWCDREEKVFAHSF